MSETNTQGTRQHNRMDAIQVNLGQEERIQLIQIFESMRNNGAILGRLTANKSGRPQRLVICVEGFEPIKEVMEVIDRIESRWLGEDQKDDEEVPGWLRDQLVDISKSIRHSGDFGYMYYNPELKRGIWVMAERDEKGGSYTSKDAIESRFMKCEGIEDFQILVEEEVDEDSGYMMIYPN